MLVFCRQTIIFNYVGAHGLLSGVDGFESDYDSGRLLVRARSCMQVLDHIMRTREAARLSDRSLTASIRHVRTHTCAVHVDRGGGTDLGDCIPVQLPGHGSGERHCGRVALIGVRADEQPIPRLRQYGAWRRATERAERPRPPSGPTARWPWTTAPCRLHQPTRPPSPMYDQANVRSIKRA